jgi:superfamily I DNA/RNA helicase
MFQHQPDADQQAAIHATERGIRIIAGAGSGKTETLVRRIAYRIEQGIDPSRMLVLTFDNNARISLNSYLDRALPGGKRPLVRTFNAYGKEILQKHFPTEHARTVLDDRTFRDFMGPWAATHQHLSVLSWDGMRRSLSDVVLAMKNEGLDPWLSANRELQAAWLRDVYLHLPPPEETLSLAAMGDSAARSGSSDAFDEDIIHIMDVFADSERVMRDRDQMLFVDQKLRSVWSLERNRPIRDAIRVQWDDVILDESQDISRVDALLVHRVLGPKSTIVIAGDDDQTLYEFRSAQSIYLRDPQRYFRNRAFRNIVLGTNYRSPAGILTHANRLIAQNTHRLEKPTVAAKTNRPGSVEVVARPSATEQHTSVVDHFLSLKRADPSMAWSDFVLLCPDNRAVATVQNVARKAGLPVAQPSSGRKPSQGIEVLTHFGAKGRQWRVVGLVDVDDTILPNPQSVRAGDLEPDRRTLYVLMTRALEHLVIGYTRTNDKDTIDRSASGEVVRTSGASRFLFEAGLVEEGGPTTPTPKVLPTTLRPESAPAARARGKATLKPTTTPIPMRRLRATQPWELRADEQKKLIEAKRRLDRSDFEFAVFNVWKVIEGITSRVSQVGSSEPHPNVRRIDVLRERGVISSDWAQTLHSWRQTRNRMVHAGESFDADLDERMAIQMVTRVGDLIEWIADASRPATTTTPPATTPSPVPGAATKPQPPEVVDKSYLAALTALVSCLQSGRPHPKTGRVVRRMTFDPVRDASEIAVLQFALLLRDVRFFIPDTHRWQRSPLFAQIARDFPLTLAANAPVLVQRPMTLRPDEHMSVAAMRALLDQESKDRGLDPHTVLDSTIRDAVDVGNGNCAYGITLRPKHSAG